MENCHFEGNEGYNRKAELALVDGVGTTTVRQCNFARGAEAQHTHTAVVLHGAETVSIEHSDFHGYHTVLANTGELKGAQVCGLVEPTTPRCEPPHSLAFTESPVATQ